MDSKSPICPVIDTSYEIQSSTTMESYSTCLEPKGTKLFFADSGMCRRTGSRRIVILYPLALAGTIGSLRSFTAFPYRTSRNARW